MRTIKLLAALVSLILLACFFLPYITLTEEGQAMIELLNDTYSEAEIAQEAQERGLPLMEVRDGALSAFELCKFMAESEEENAELWAKWLLVLLFAAGGIFALLALLCSVRGRPILLLLLSAGTYLCDHFIVRSGFLALFSESAWDFSISSIAYPILSAVLAILAIAMFIAKRRQKRAQRQAE